jgi:hypothetical protein
MKPPSRKAELTRSKEPVHQHSIFNGVSMQTSVLIITSVSLICFANSVDGDFVHDDRLAIVDNRDSDPSHSSWLSIFSNDFWGTELVFVSVGCCSC